MRPKGAREYIEITKNSTGFQPLFARVRKYREVMALVGLIGAAAITFFVHGKDPDQSWPLLGDVNRSILSVEAPVEQAISSAVAFGMDTWQGYVDLRRVRQENLALREKVLNLQQELGTRGELAGENQRLKDLVHFADSAPLETVAAAVTGDNLAPAALSRVVRIGVGLNAGVRKGMAVLSAGAAVGRVQQAYRSFSEVQLLVDPASAVAVRVERSRARANVMGTGRDRRAKLEYALRSDDIEDGDSLVTSGTDGVFPPGLLVGKVTEVQRKTSATFLRAQVIPAVDPRSLEEVLVVLAQNENLESEPAARK
jgi:rod shape-determining protein MreC